MKLEELYPSRWLRASDVTKPILTTIKNVVVEEVGESEEKPVLYFQDPSHKPLILNRTNGQTIGLLYGDDTELWRGKPLVLFCTKVQFQGKMVDAIRVRPPKPAARPAPAPAPMASDDDVNF
jgi:hypothetical protein